MRSSLFTTALAALVCLSASPSRTLSETAGRTTAQQTEDRIGLPGVTPEALKAAKAILKYSGSEDAIMVGVEAIKDSYVRSAMHTSKLTHEQAMMFVDDYLFPEMSRRTDELIAICAEVYASKLSVSDMEAIAAFYETPVGQKLIGLRGEITAGIAAGQTAWRDRVTADAWATYRRTHAELGGPN